MGTRRRHRERRAKGVAAGTASAIQERKGRVEEQGGTREGREGREGGREAGRGSIGRSLVTGCNRQTAAYPKQGRRLSSQTQSQRRNAPPQRRHPISNSSVPRFQFAL